MAAAVALRSDFTGPDLRRLARRTQDAKQARRLLALAAIYDGASRTDAARMGDVSLQIVRDWVIQFNAHGPDGLVDRKAPGPAVSVEHVAIAQRWRRSSRVVRSPLSTAWFAGGWSIYANGSGTSFRSASPSRPSAVNFARWGTASFPRVLDITPRPRGPSRLLKKFPRQTGRDRTRKRRRVVPHRDLVRRRSPDRAEEQDHPPLGEARHPAIGAADQRTASTYIFGAICPVLGKGCGARPARLQHRGDEPPPGRDRSRRRARRHQPCFSSIKPHGISRISSSSRTTSPSCRCPPSVPNSTRSRTSGSSCATTARAAPSRAAALAAKAAERQRTPRLSRYQ